MNITYTLTPQEVAQRHGKPRRSSMPDRLANGMSSMMMAAMAVIAFGTMMGMSPRLIGPIIVILSVFYFYNHRKGLFRLPSYRLSIGQAAGPMTVSISSNGIVTTRGSETTSSRWPSLVRVRENTEGVSLEFIDGTVRWVPLRALGDANAYRDFVAFAHGFLHPSLRREGADTPTT